MSQNIYDFLVSSFVIRSPVCLILNTFTCTYTQFVVRKRTQLLHTYSKHVQSTCTFYIMQFSKSPPPPTGVDFHTSNDYQPQQNKILLKILGFIIKCRTNTYFLKITIFIYLKKNIVSVHKQATLCSIISYINNPAAK